MIQNRFQSIGGKSVEVSKIVSKLSEANVVEVVFTTLPLVRRRIWLGTKRFP